MRFTTLLLTATLLTSLPAASATGHLINFGLGSTSFTFGDNVLGGQGDTIDVGFQNEQCSDEDDVVDVGIDNREGETACRKGEPCRDEPSSPFLVPLLEGTGIVSYGPTRDAPHCSDDGDTVDIGILNDEGSRDLYCNDPACPTPNDGDARDGVDVGVANREWGDGDDGADAGAWNCEYSDQADRLDVGVGNIEYKDEQDGLDVSLRSSEWNDGPDGNGVNILPDNSGNVECLGWMDLPRLFG